MNLPSQKILVVDDEPAIVDIVRHLLLGAGFYVETATSGEEALELFARAEFDVVLTDVQMTGISGFEVATHVTAHDAACKVIVMTAFDSYEMVLQSLKGGAYDYLDKPLNNHEKLLIAVRRAAEASRMQRQNQDLVRQLTDSNAHLTSANERLIRLNRTLKYLAVTDGLTNLHNRRYIDKTLEREVGRRSRYGNAISVVLLDIDHFKRFNDEHGHEGGDVAIRHVADLLRNTARTADVVGRYGGEEFIVLMPNTSPADAMGYAERLRQAIENAPCVVDGASAALTVSIGVSGMDIDAPIRNYRDIINMADQAMYRSKSRGRNCVTLHDQPDRKPSTGKVA